MAGIAFCDFLISFLYIQKFRRCGWGRNRETDRLQGGYVVPTVVYSAKMPDEVALCRADALECLQSMSDWGRNFGGGVGVGYRGFRFSPTSVLLGAGEREIRRARKIARWAPNTRRRSKAVGNNA